MLKRLLVLVALATGLISHAYGQTYPGQFPANTVFGNATGSTAAPLPGAVINGQMANMASHTLKCNSASSSGTPQDCNYPVVNVIDPAFGAKCDGSTHDEVAIQAAINSLPNDGGVVLFPNAQNCVIGATLTIGNGTTSAVSTKRGVILHGAGMPLSAAGLPFFNGYPAPVGPKITWAGGTNSNIIQVNGPLQGYGVQNLIIDCASTAGTNGILVTSAGQGDNRDLAILNCGASGIASTSNPLGGYTGVGNVDSNGTSWTNITVLVPQVTAAKGVLCNGDTGGTSDTDYNTFINTLIRTPGAASNFGFYMATCDGNIFINSRATGFAGAGVGMAFDYTGNSNFPNSNHFYNYEIGNQFSNIGSPSANVLISRNKFYGLIESNLALPPNLQGTLSVDGVWQTFTPNLTCTSGAATFTLHSAKFKQPGSKITHIEIDFSIATGATCTQVTFNLPNTPNSNGAITGLNLITGLIDACVIKVSGAAGICAQVGATAWNVADEAVFSGTYESAN